MRPGLSAGLVFVVAAVWCANAPFPAAPDPAQHPTPVVIKAGRLIDGTGAAPRRNKLVFVRAARIEKIADAASASIPSGAKVVDLSTATLLPGLIDSHTHLFLWGEEPDKGGYDANILKAGVALRAARATVAARRHSRLE